MDVKTKRLLGVVAALVALAVVVAAVTTAGGGPVGATLVVGYVDMQRALDAHPKKASSEEAFNQFARAKAAELRRLAQNKSPAEQADLARRTQEEIFKRRAELLSALDKDIRAAVERVAKRAGVSVVLDRTVVLYGGVDLTDQVVQELQGR
ncbi:MAG: OmpH family outer membrane protein [Armatimonadota bacterium]|nr:OmpH family outer membrane protein [Armatimonadota bacterium]